MLSVRAFSKSKELNKIYINLFLVSMEQLILDIGNSVPTFVGMKFTSPNVEEATNALRASCGKFTIFAGTNHV